MDQENTPPKGQITAGSVAKYALLPGILPRLKRLGFVLAKFLHVFTTLFGAAGLIPANHPCLRAENIGRYKFTEIVGLAAHNVKLTRAHLPQTIMFFAIIGAYLLTILTAVLSVLQMVAGTQAHAQFFSNDPNITPPATDYAYEFLTQVFGKINIGNLWLGNGISPRDNPLSPFIAVFGEMMSFYSKMLLVVAAFLVIYLLINTVISAARTGRPWGEKFDSIWAPLRLAAAIGLLVPIHPIGYNGAQLVVFQFAHWGSAIATNLWTQGITKGFSSEKIIDAQGVGRGYRAVRALFLMEVCQKVYADYYAKAGISNPIEFNEFPDPQGRYIQYSYGTKDDPKYCGAIRLQLPPPVKNMTFTSPSGFPTAAFGGVIAASKTIDIHALARRVTEDYKNAYTALKPEASFIAGSIVTITSTAGTGFSLTNVPFQGKYHQKMVYAWMDQLDKNKDGVYFNEANYTTMITDYNEALKVNMAEQTRFGWANAGGFFLRISQFASDAAEAFDNVPEVVAMPVLLANPGQLPNGEDLIENLDDDEKEAINHMANVLKISDVWFRESPPQNQKLNVVGERSTWDDYMKKIDYFNIWKNDVSSQAELAGKANSEDVDYMNYFNGMRADSWLASFKGGRAIHPIGEIAEIGTTMLRSGLAMVVAGGILSSLEYKSEWGVLVTVGVTVTMQVIGSFIMKIGSIMVLAGFLMSVYIPAIPFMFFSFAVIEWLASVLEAVIGAPLWCLSLISVEGEGLGRGQQGFNTFIELMLRPAVIVISLIACALLYTGAVRFMNHAYGTFMGEAEYGMLMSLYHAIFYLFLIYGITNSIFKLMNQIPAQFFRWSAMQAQPFQTQMGVEISQQAATAFGKEVLGAAESTGKGVASGIKSYKEGKKKNDDRAAALRALGTSGINPRTNPVEAKAYIDLVNDGLIPPPPPPPPPPPTNNNTGNARNNPPPPNP